MTTRALSGRRLLDRLPDDATVWPGHDYGVRPSSTIGLERATNPFLRCPDLAAFMAQARLADRQVTARPENSPTHEALR